MPNLACVSRAQSHIDQKLTLKPAQAGASWGPPMEALLTSKCVKFIGSAVEWVNRLYLKQITRDVSTVARDDN